MLALLVKRIINRYDDGKMESISLYIVYTIEEASNNVDSLYFSLTFDIPTRHNVTTEKYLDSQPIVEI